MITLQQRIHSAPTPAGWRLDKLHQVLKVRRGNKNTGMRENNLLSLSYGQIIRKNIEADSGLLPESFETYQIVEPGNIIMRLTDLQNDKRSIRQGLVRERGIITSAYDALEVVGDNDSSFWAYALLALDLAKYYYSLGGGVRQSVKFSEFPNERIYRPDLATQKRIAAHLDQQSARIDALIEKNERLINLCEEKARAVIDSVFSKAKSLIAIKHVANINYDTLSSNSPDDMEIRYADLSRVFPRGGIDPEVMAFKDAPSRARRIVHENDVLFASVGPFSKKVLSAREEDEGAVVSTGFFVMKAKRGHHSRFLEKILQSTHVLSAVEKGAVGAIYAAINDSTFRNIRIPAFSYEEQVKFSEDMEAQISNLSALSEKAGRMNVLLKEKRSALITAAVTGQIDIPEE